MNLKTNEFQTICKTILLAVDNNAANLELVTQDHTLYLNVTNKEYYVSMKFPIAEIEEDFHAVVDAALFLNLISGITSENFELTKVDNTIVVKADKSKYKLPMIYENDALLKLPTINIPNKTIEMPISLDILRSILNVNSKELLKIKNTKTVDYHEVQSLYFLTNEGCFTFTTGATLNNFTLEKPVKVLLNDRIVKLFKLFKTDVNFTLGYDALPSGQIQTKVSFATDDTYLSAIVINDDILISKIQGPCTATKQFIEEKYANHLVISVPVLSAAISRLTMFTKGSIDKANMHLIMANVHIDGSELTISDRANNSETITADNGSYTAEPYDMAVNIADLKLVLDSCTEDHITLNCGNNRSIVINHGNVSNLIPEGKRD